MLGEATYWVAAGASFGVSVTLSVLGGALTHFHHGRMEALFEERGRLDAYRHCIRSLSQYKLAIWTMDAIADSILAIAMVELNAPLTESVGAPKLAILTLEMLGVIAIFAEAIPRSWGAQNADRVMAHGLPMVDLLSKAAFPLTWSVGLIDAFFARLAGQPAARDHSHLIVDILNSANEAEREGVLGQEEAGMIKSVLDFKDLPIGTVMTPRIDMVMLPVDTPVDEAVALVLRGGPSRIPLFRETRDQVVGILYARDLLKCHFKSTPDVASVRSLEELMHRALFIPETKRCGDLLREFKAKRVHIAIVLDEYGGTAGLVTAEDLLEEIVGDIDDEYDAKESPGIERLSPDVAVLDGKIHISEINEFFGLSLPEDGDYETVAGYLMSALDKIPKIGERWETEEGVFEVLEADERRVLKLKLELAAQTASAAPSSNRGPSPKSERA